MVEFFLIMVKILFVMIIMILQIVIIQYSVCFKIQTVL